MYAFFVTSQPLSVGLWSLRHIGMMFRTLCVSFVFSETFIPKCVDRPWDHFSDLVNTRWAWQVSYHSSLESESFVHLFSIQFDNLSLPVGNRCKVLGTYCTSCTVNGELYMLHVLYKLFWVHKFNVFRYQFGYADGWGQIIRF